MTGLRTIWGVSLDKVQSDFGDSYVSHLTSNAEKYIQDKLLKLSKVNNDTVLLATKKGHFLIDGIASELFLI